MPKAAEDDYPELAQLSANGGATIRIEAALALTEIDKWRRKNEDDEKAWQIEMSDD